MAIRFPPLVKGDMSWSHKDGRTLAWAKMADRAVKPGDSVIFGDLFGSERFSAVVDEMDGERLFLIVDWDTDASIRFTDCQLTPQEAS